AVEPTVEVAVFVQRPGVLGGRGRAGQPRHVPGAVDGRLDREHMVDVELVPAAERGLADRLPVRAAGERLTAAASLVVTQPALPQVHRLADRADPGDLV